MKMTYEEIKKMRNALAEFDLIMKDCEDRWENDRKEQEKWTGKIIDGVSLRDFSISGKKEAAAARRGSMELTRALAKFRRGELA